MMDARRVATYRERVGFALFLLLFLGGSELGWWFWYEGNRTVAEMALCGVRTLGIVVLGEFVLTIIVVPELVARSIATERERSTRDALFLTRLTDWEILLGKLALGLCRYTLWLATGLPILVFLSWAGGMDPRLVCLSYPALATTALWIGAMSVWVALDAPETRRAISISALLAWLWMSGPMLVLLIAPRILPAWATALVLPVNAWLLASSPLGVLLGIVGFAPLGGTLVYQSLWMMGLQIAGAIPLLALALLRFRSVRAGGKPGRATWIKRLRQSRWRIWPRPRCGADPLLWKELFTSPLDGLARLLELAAILPLLVIAGLILFYLARPAAVEAATYGYGSLEHYDARSTLNMILKGVFAAGSMILILLVSAYGAESIATERAKATWQSLIATSLDGRQILRAKRLGAIWRARVVLGALAFAGLLGLVCGAIHPVALLAHSALAVCAIWFCAALGTYCGLKSLGQQQALNATLGTTLVLLFSAGLLWVLPEEMAYAPLGAASLPFASWLTNLSYPGFYALCRGRFTTALTVATIIRQVGGLGVIATYVVALLWQVSAAAFLVRAAERSFDRLVGRPVRPSSAAPRARAPFGGREPTAQACPVVS
jgi:hypothetical protein